MMRLRWPTLVSIMSATFLCGLPTPDSTIVDASWRQFVATFVQLDGRVVRPEHDGDTVSEAQAYGMLRAAWMRDQPAFDRIWRWSETHLSRTLRGEDHLLAWHWKPDPSGTTGRVVDWNPASDADQDYAFALLLAASHWQTPSLTGLPRYDDHARVILSDLLAHATTRDRDGTLVLLPGPWAHERSRDGHVVLNPSYFAPAWYRVFSRFTGDSRWDELIAGSYRVLEAVCGVPGLSIRAVPDWVQWQSARVWRPRDDVQAMSSWDAVRVPWRVGTDWLWFQAPEAFRFATRCLQPLVDRQLARHGGMAVEVSLSGEALGAIDHPLANAMFSFAVLDAERQSRLMQRILAKTAGRSPEGLFFDHPRGYYVNSLSYLPFLARAGSYLPPRGIAPLSGRLTTP